MLEAFEGLISFLIEIAFFAVPILVIGIVGTVVNKIKTAKAMKQAKVQQNYVDDLFFLDYGEGMKFYEMGE